MTTLLAGLAGTILLALSFAVLDWYRGSGSSSLVDGGYADLRDVNTLAQLYGFHAPLILRAYFSWLAFALFLVGVLGAGASALRPPPGLIGRWVGAVGGFGGFVATCWAMQSLSSAVTQRHGITVLTGSRAGLWSCLIGFLLLGAAAAFGLRSPEGDAPAARPRAR